MALKCATVMQLMDRLAPPRLAADWDNVGLQIGDPAAAVTGIVLTLDVDDKALAVALDQGANLIISHHPVFFKPASHLRYDQPHARLIRDLVTNRIQVFSAHTNLDVARGGVNDALAGRLCLQEVEVLAPEKEDELYKIVVFVPESHEAQVRQALGDSGAGWIGNYSHCTFRSPGTGAFLPLEGSHPFLGARGRLEEVAEVRLETIVPQSRLAGCVKAMLKAHPYEEVAYDLYRLANQGETLGLGRLGRLAEPVTLKQFAALVRERLRPRQMRVAGDPESIISKVAVCGGAGARLLARAACRGAQVMVTGDVDYHLAREALALAVIDAGHGATEAPVLPALAAYLEGELKNLKVSGVNVAVAAGNDDPWWQD